MPYHGRKPSSPAKAPRSNGRRPPPPPPRTGRNMGKSSMVAIPQVTIMAVILFIISPAGIVLGAGWYLLHGYGVV